MRRLLVIAGFLACTTSPSHSAVMVESSSVIIDEAQSLGGGTYGAYPITLQQGEAIYVNIETAGGIDNAVQTWLVDLPDFQLLQAGRQFNTWPTASPHVVQHGAYSFVAPATNVYYLVLDNRPAFLTRNVQIHVERTTQTPNAWSAQIAALYTARYEGLKALFKFNDFNITVKHCETDNAFSNPNITMCVELLNEFARDSIPAAEEFVFYHEVGHSLLRLWGDPNWDVEDAADSFATAMMMIMGEQDAALQAAQWFASKNPMDEATATLFRDNRHSLSIQRARNVINWLNQKDDRLRRWLRVMIPNMTDTGLQKIAAMSEIHPPTNDDDASLVLAVHEELERREDTSSNQ